MSMNDSSKNGVEVTEVVEKLVPLSCLDLLFCPFLGVYFYEERLDYEHLKASLEDTIRHIPILSSEIVKIEGKYFFKLVPNNIIFVEKSDIDEDLHSLYLPDKETGILAFEEGKKFYEYFEKVKTGPNLYIPICGVPVLSISLLHTKYNKSVLCVCINHSIGDAHALAYFMNCWSAGESRIVKNFNLSRSSIRMTQNFDLFQCKRPILRNLSDHNPLEKVLDEEKGLIILTQEECIEKIVHFPQHLLNEWKKRVDETFPNHGLRISSNDVVSAFLWKYLAIVSGKPKSGVIPLRIIANIRNRFSDLDEKYFGNAISSGNTDLTHEEITDSLSFPELILTVRKLVNIISDELVQTTIDIIQFCEENKNMKHYHGLGNKNTSLIMNDWRVKDRIRPHFSFSEKKIVCERVVWSPPENSRCRMPHLVTVFLPDGGDGLDARMHVRKSVLEKISGMEFPSLLTLEKMKKMKF